MIHIFIYLIINAVFDADQIQIHIKRDGQNFISVHLFVCY